MTQNLLDPQIKDVLEQLFEGRFPSRNRNFYAHEAPHVRQAVKIYRFLQSVLRDFRAEPQDVTVTPVGHSFAGNYGVRIEFPALHGNRTAYLADYELELCTRYCPELASLIEGKLPGAFSRNA